MQLSTRHTRRASTCRCLERIAVPLEKNSSNFFPECSERRLACCWIASFTTLSCTLAKMKHASLQSILLSRPNSPLQEWRHENELQSIPLNVSQEDINLYISSGIWRRSRLLVPHVGIMNSRFSRSRKKGMESLADSPPGTRP